MVRIAEADGKGTGDLHIFHGFPPGAKTNFHQIGIVQAAPGRVHGVGDALGVKASGGIRDAETALAMINAGASRLGVSATNAILAGLED